MNVFKQTFLLFILLSVQAVPLQADTDMDFFFKKSSDYEAVLIKEVRSADSFTILNHQGKKEIIKMIGLRAPKAPKIKQVDVERDDYGFPVKDNANPISTFEERSFLFVREMLQDKKVRLEFDSSKKDEENNTLAYVYLADDNTFVNLEILRQGMADLQIRPPNTKYKTELRRAYQEAREEKRGLQGQ
ncbi:MAG: thermonuclease family protein [Candidatus Omnitrophota bacterium]